MASNGLPSIEERRMHMQLLWRCTKMYTKFLPTMFWSDWKPASERFQLRASLSLVFSFNPYVHMAPDDPNINLQYCNSTGVGAQSATDQPIQVGSSETSVNSS